jgi:hypothetical protein
MGTSLLLRLSLISVCVVLVVILLALLYPFHFLEGPWQAFFGNWNEPYVRDNPFPEIEQFLLFLVLPLILPLLVVWMTFKFPTRIISLIGLLISVGILLLPALTLLICLALAIALPIMRAHGQSHLRMGSEAEPGSHRVERGTRPYRTDAGAPSERGRLNVLVPILALLGILAHLGIFLSLFWTYIDYYDVDMDFPLPSTGWQVLLQSFHTQPYVISLMPPPSLPLIVVLLAALFIPAMGFLTNMVLWPVRGALKDALLSKTMLSVYLLTRSGLVLSTLCYLTSFLSRGGDSTNPSQNTYVAFAIPSLMFLISGACSYLLLRQYRAQVGREKLNV